MRSGMRRAALAAGLVILQACSGTGSFPGARPTPAEPNDRTYGEPPEGQEAGAVESLESEEESGGHFATMVDMLRGRVAGLRVMESAGGEISIRIRGDQSVYFNQEPLLVIDGVPVPPYAFSNTLRTMNPRDVRSIRVLKDAGSTSVYGIRGAHGVILITLKRH